MGKPLKIGISPRFLHEVPPELGFKGKTLQYLESSVVHWLMSSDTLVFMVPSVSAGESPRPGKVRIADYASELDALVLQGGADVSPVSYGEQPLRSDWRGDRVRDVYEIALLQEFVSRGKPVLGICRGLQLINVAFGGTLFQDIGSQREQAGEHHDPEAYDRHYHEISFVAGSGLAGIYPGLGRTRVNSIHHQAVKELGRDLAVEAVSVPDGVVEALRRAGPGYVVGVQWHPEFHDPRDAALLDGGPLLGEFLRHAELARDHGPRPAAETARA
jgi:gamma-glutamyl-gamma-aminobutyrate hydrolase PuuD